MQYQAEMELSGKTLSDTETDKALDELPGLSAVISHDGPHPRVLLTINAESVVQATVLSVAAVERATGRTVVTLEVTPTELWDARQGFVPVPPLAGVTEAAEILGVSRQRVLQLVDAGKLPAQRVGNALVFARATVNAFAATRDQDTDAAEAAVQAIVSDADQYR